MQTVISLNVVDFKSKDSAMPRSILNQYIDIVKALAENGPLSTHELAPFLEVNPSSLKERVRFLTYQRAIRENRDKAIVTYSISKRGTEILKFFKVQTLAKVAIDRN